MFGPGVHPAVIVTSFLSGIFMIALFAVVLSQRAKTTDVISQAGTSLTDIIKAAVSPITAGGGESQ